MSISVEAYRDLAQACQKRAAERDTAECHIIDMQAQDFERRFAVAQALAIHCACGIPPNWDVLLMRLNECLTTFRQRQRA